MDYPCSSWIIASRPSVGIGEREDFNLAKKGRFRGAALSKMGMSFSPKMGRRQLSDAPVSHTALIRIEEHARTGQALKK